MRPLFALFVRSLRQDSRALGTYVLRSLLVLLALFGIFTTSNMFRWSGAPGRQFFSQMLWIDLWLFIAVGLTYFSSVITEEKEDETLGLLRMTNLSALSILLGKSVSRLCGALCLVAAQLPFLLVSVTMGGVRVVQVLAGFVWLLGFIFMLANLGLLASVVCRRTAAAALFAAVLTLPLIFGPWDVLGGWWTRVSGIGPGDLTPLARFFDAWTAFSANHRLESILRTDFAGPFIDRHIAACLLVGTACFLLAWLLFTPCADRAAPESSGRVATVIGTPRCRRAGRPAIVWRDFHFLHQGFAGMAVKVALTILTVIGAQLPRLWPGGPDEAEFFILFTSWWVGLLLLLVLAFDASRIFKHERREQTLTSLATLPVGITQVIRQKIRAALVHSWAPLLAGAVCLLLTGFLALQEMSRHRPRGDDLFYIGFACTYGVFTALFLPVLVAWFSLRLRWGAFPVGVMVWFFGNWIAGVGCMLAFREASLPILAMTALGLLLGFGQAIPARLARLAAED